MSDKVVNKFSAVYGKNDAPLVSVLAGDEHEAKEKITEQLSRPGRYDYFRLWREHGSRVISRGVGR